MRTLDASCRFIESSRLPYRDESPRVLHYDADLDRILAVTGQPCEWVVPSGSSADTAVEALAANAVPTSASFDVFVTQMSRNRVKCRRRHMRQLVPPSVRPDTGECERGQRFFAVARFLPAATDFVVLTFFWFRHERRGL